MSRHRFLTGLQIRNPFIGGFILAKLYKVGNAVKDAILTIMAYIKSETGTEPTQEEVASLLSSYFIINEVGNQIKYQLKKGKTKPTGGQGESDDPFWKMDLKAGPGKNSLVRVGIFHQCIKEALDRTRLYIKKTIGVDPGYALIARCLKSNFILSEILNQLDHQRKVSDK